MKNRILVIDDDEPIHFLVKNLLGKEFDLVHARNAQEAIDLLTDSRINLILSDIHMPGLSGLQLLESLKKDKDKKKIPILIMTSLPTIENEKKALQLGASDFIKKDLFTSDKNKIVELIRMKLVTNVIFDDLTFNLEESKNKLVMSLMDSALLGRFNDTVDVLCSELLALLNAEFVGMWVLGEASAQVITQKGEFDLKNSKRDLVEEPGFDRIVSTRSPYFSNHVYSEDTFFPDIAKRRNLSSEVAVPIFSVSEQGLLSSDLKVPDDSKLFGLILIKRSVLFSRLEFELTAKLVLQAGTILWRLYRR